MHKLTSWRIIQIPRIRSHQQTTYIYLKDEENMHYNEFSLHKPVFHNCGMKRGLFDLGKYFLKMVVWKTVILCGYFY
jgi:hypothetical protein